MGDSIGMLGGVPTRSSSFDSGPHLSLRNLGEIWGGADLISGYYPIGMRGKGRGRGRGRGRRGGEKGKLS